MDHDLHCTWPKISTQMEYRCKGSLWMTWLLYMVFYIFYNKKMFLNEKFTFMLHGVDIKMSYFLNLNMCENNKLLEFSSIVKIKVVKFYLHCFFLFKVTNGVLSSNVPFNKLISYSDFSGKRTRKSEKFQIFNFHVFFFYKTKYKNVPKLA